MGYTDGMNVEAVLLGAVQIFPEYAPNILPELEIEDFSEPFQPVFAALSGYWQANNCKKIDAVALCNRYPDLKEMLLACVSACDNNAIAVTRERVIDWVDIAKKEASVRRFQSLAFETVNKSNSMDAFGKLPYDSAVDLYQQMGKALELTRNQEAGFKSLGECIDDYIRALDKKPQYFKTGISSLDKTMHLARGNYFIIGGRPSAGKTALSLQIAANMAQAGHCVCYFSLETDEKTLTERLIANRLYAPLHAVKNKTVSMNDLDRLAECKKYRFYIRSASGRDVAWIKAQALRMKAEVIFIDYLQLLHQTGAKDRYTAVTQLSMDLHELAQTTGILVVALAQLNRGAAHAAPTNADLRESGQLEQDADVILLLSADGEEYYSVISKNKEGEIGLPHLVFDTTTQRFTVAAKTA